MAGVHTRPLVVILIAMLTLALVGTWLIAADAGGPLPAGTFEATRVADWPVTPERANEIRRDAFRRAAVRWRGSIDDPSYSDSDRGSTLPSAEPLTCRYLADPPSGTSAKFNCVLDGGEVLKVKYGRNSEIQAEAAATRLLRRLGYAADEVRVVSRVRCYGCPRFPFLTTQLLSIVHMPALLGPHGHDAAYTDFEWPAVERRFHAPAIETPTDAGWAWFELASSMAPQADLDALRLLAVFLAHWDNKAVNQRLVCLDPPAPGPDFPCREPLLMIQDLGATFGPTKVNVAAWRNMPVWSDRRTCTVSMKAMPYQGATFPDARLSEAGRVQLAHALSALSRDEIESLFKDARFADFQSGTDDRRDLDAWVSAFEHRVDQITHAGPC